MKSKFPIIFKKSFSTPIIDYKGDLIFKEDKTIYKKAYEVSLRLRQQVVYYLDTLEKEGVITPIEASEWASLIMAIVKTDQTIGLVIDCKVPINKVLLPNIYPLLVARDLCHTLWFNIFSFFRPRGCLYTAVVYRAF